VTLAGTEFGLSAFGPDLLKKLQKKEEASFSFTLRMIASSKGVERAVLDGEAQIGITSRAPSSRFRSRRLGKYASATYAGPGHRLYGEAERGRKIDIQAILEFPFVSFLGTVFEETDEAYASPDGWRDDQFQRRIGFKTDGVEAALRVMESGLCLGYLPQPLVGARNLLPVKISGCPFRCETEAFLIARTSDEYDWMRALF